MMSICEAERHRRSEAIRKARNSVRLEGVVLDTEIEALNQRFIDGEISSAEHTRLGIEHVKSKHAGAKQESTMTTLEVKDGYIYGVM